MAENKYYEQSGSYCICWCGPKSSLVYTAWFNKVAIGYFKTGSDVEKKEAAKQACKHHHQQKRAA